MVLYKVLGYFSLVKEKVLLLSLGGDVSLLDSGHPQEPWEPEGRPSNSGGAEEDMLLYIYFIDIFWNVTQPQRESIHHLAQHSSG